MNLGLIVLLKHKDYDEFDNRIKKAKTIINKHQSKDSLSTNILQILKEKSKLTSDHFSLSEEKLNEINDTIDLLNPLHHAIIRFFKHHSPSG